MKADYTAGNAPGFCYAAMPQSDVNLYIVMTGECKPLHWGREGGAAKNVNLYSVVVINARELGVYGLAICCF